MAAYLRRKGKDLVCKRRFGGLVLRRGEGLDETMDVSVIFCNKARMKIVDDDAWWFVTIHDDDDDNDDDD